MQQSSSRSGGPGLFGLLFILFLGLKLTGNIDWSYWWVFAPLYGPIAVFGGAFVAVALIVAIVKAFTSPFKPFRH